MRYSIIFNDKLGRGMADLQSLRSPINGHSFSNDQFHEFLSLLHGKVCTLQVITECAFFSSLSLLYYSSANRFDIPQLLQANQNKTINARSRPPLSDMRCPRGLLCTCLARAAIPWGQSFITWETNYYMGPFFGFGNLRKLPAFHIRAMEDLDTIKVSLWSVYNSKGRAFRGGRRSNTISISMAQRQLIDYPAVSRQGITPGFLIFNFGEKSQNIQRGDRLQRVFRVLNQTIVILIRDGDSLEDRCATIIACPSLAQKVLRTGRSALLASETVRRLTDGFWIRFDEKGYREEAFPHGKKLSRWQKGSEPGHRESRQSGKEWRKQRMDDG